MEEFPQGERRRDGVSTKFKKERKIKEYLGERGNEGGISTKFEEIWKNLCGVQVREMKESLWRVTREEGTCRGCKKWKRRNLYGV